MTGQKKYSIHLLTLQHKQVVNYGYLPPGRYNCFFTINNPGGGFYALSIESDNMRTIIKHASDKKNDTWHVELEIPLHPVNENVTIKVQLTEGENIFIMPVPVPHLITTRNIENPVVKHFHKSELNDLFIKDKHLNEACKEQLRPLDIYLHVFGTLQQHNNASPQLKTNDYFFHELIDLEAATRQLDYVVFEKLFKGYTSNILKRVLKKTVRAFIVLCYRLITTSPNRKRYLAKFYRNYVNLNYLSERKKL